DDPAARYRFALAPVRKGALIVVATLLGIFAGTLGQGRWQDYLKWRNGASLGEKDPHFDLDKGFYLFDLPWWSFLSSFAFTIVIITIVVTLFVQYVYGGFRIAGRGLKFTRGAQIQIAVLAAI